MAALRTRASGWPSCQQATASPYGVRRGELPAGLSSIEHVSKWVWSSELFRIWGIRLIRSMAACSLKTAERERAFIHSLIHSFVCFIPISRFRGAGEGGKGEVCDHSSPETDCRLATKLLSGQSIPFHSVVHITLLYCTSSWSSICMNKLPDPF